ncbi:MAG: OsmC family protein [Bacteroidia bacterium]|nr:OsmC family protein [Bacteroidia bacterium]
MEIILTWEQKGLEFEGSDNHGNTVMLDGNRLEGLSPMSLLLQAAGACSAIDVLDILNKMRTPPTAMRVEVKGTRKEGEPPRPWTHMHIRFFLSGDLQAEKVQRAVDLSLDKYCSVTANLKGVTEVTADFQLV